MLVKKQPDNNKITQTKVSALPRTFTVIDFETTALDPEKGRIIEIGAIRFTDGEMVSSFNTLVYQDPEDYPITEEVTKLTGHTQADVLKGMDEETAINVLLAFINGSLIVGQNILFDYSFLDAAADMSGWAIHYDLLDTLTIGRDRKAYPHKLENLCKHYGINTEGNWHSAYYDALATGQLLLAMHKEDKTFVEGKQVMDYINVIGYRAKYGPPAWVPDWITLKTQGSNVINN